MDEVRQSVVLMAEDNPDDIELTRAAFEESKFHVNLHVVRDGVEAMAFLRREGVYSDAPRPDLLLLDINMPRMDGRQVLEAIREDPGLATLPVVMLTTSSSEEDIAFAYYKKANCYVTKPVDFTQFTKVVNSIQDFWFTLVKMPPPQA